MAITSASQIYNTEKAKLAASYLKNAKSVISNAKEYLTTASQYCTTDYFSIGGESVPEAKIKEMIDSFNEMMANLDETSNQIVKLAEIIKQNDTEEYEAYLKQKAEEEAAAAAAAAAAAEANS